MRTTVDIHDDVLRKAKEVAARSGVTLGVLVSDALRLSLERQSGPRKRVRLPSYTPKIPGTFPRIDLTNNEALTAFLEEERDAALMALINEHQSADS